MQEAILEDGLYDPKPPVESECRFRFGKESTAWHLNGTSQRKKGVKGLA
jgi:hypothetical protein